MQTTHEVPKWIAKQVYLRQALLDDGLLDQLAFVVQSLREGNLSQIDEFAEDWADSDSDEDPLAQLEIRVANAERLAKEAFDTSAVTPGDKLVRGQRLSREEFHLLRAGAAIMPDGTPLVPLGNFPDLFKALDLHWRDEYDLYCLLHYEDDEWLGLIYPEVYRNRRSKYGVPFIITPVPPESVSKHRLTSEQRHFFENEFPEDYAKFRP